MQWYYEIIPLLIGILYRSLFYGIKAVLGVELGLRVLSSALQVAAFHYGGLPADLLLLLVGFLVRVLVYGPNFYMIEFIALAASVLWRLMIYAAEYINKISKKVLHKSEEDRTKGLVPVPTEEEQRRQQAYIQFLYPEFGTILPASLTSF